MSITARLNTRITQLAVGRAPPAPDRPRAPHAPVRRPVPALRRRADGDHLCAFCNAGSYSPSRTALVPSHVTTSPSSVCRHGTTPRLSSPGSTTHPSAQTMANWRRSRSACAGTASPAFPDPYYLVGGQPRSASVARDQRSRRSDHWRFRPRSDTQVADVHAAPPTRASSCTDYTNALAAQDNRRRTQARGAAADPVRDRARPGMSLPSLGLGGSMAGRVLQPLEDSLPRRSASSSPTPHTSCARH